MPRKMLRKLTVLENLIMDCVWTLERATVRQVMEALESVKPMAYNTVLTMMRILREKGFLESRREGRTDVYGPTVTRAQIGRQSVAEVLDRFFAGSARALVSQLLDSDSLSPDEIRAIRREVDRKLRDKRNGKPARRQARAREVGHV
jgi:BlaI family penicillinase repressor